MAAFAQPDAYRCIECGLPYRANGFSYYHDEMENGPAYWSDRGILCSPRCALAHHRRREAEGTLREKPAPDPLMPAMRR